MDINWLSAFIDLPATVFESGAAFWARATDSTLSASRGPDGAFATLIPASGESCLGVQRLGQQARIHLDFHVDSLPEARDHAVVLGATLIYEDNHAVLQSPAGLTFCFVTHGGRAELPQPVGTPRLHLLNQVSIDVPHDRFVGECDFWSALTGWELSATPMQQFASLSQPHHIPLRLLLQQLGRDDELSTARAHLDIACGPHFVEVSQTFLDYGAELVEHHEHWTTMSDPAGLLFCLTRRDPVTRALAPPL
jgi:hypothetical protein